GYELKNREIRVLIDEKTGDVTYWGSVDGKANFLNSTGVTVSFQGDPTTTFTDGYIEKRDDQTWQFMGTDASQIRWRKIYCLEGRSLAVTYLIENLRKEPMKSRIALTHQLKGIGDTETIRFNIPGGAASIQTFNEKHPNDGNFCSTPTPTPP